MELNMKVNSFIALTTVMLLPFVSTLQAKGLCDCSDTLVSAKSRLYVDLGLGQAFDTHLPSAGYTSAVLPSPPFGPDERMIMQLTPKEHYSANNLMLETGFLWSEPYQVGSPYFPFVSLGLRYQYSNFSNKKTLMKLSINGETSQNNYKLSQNSLLANLKMDFYRWDRVMPYANLGLGVSWNKNKPQGPFFTDGGITKWTSSSSQNKSFSYQVGIGLDYLVAENFWLSLGYSYDNFGLVEVAKFSASGDALPDDARLAFDSVAQPFNFRNLTAHTIQLTGRYVFG
jgi:hypothetical protein